MQFHPYCTKKSGGAQSQRAGFLKGKCGFGLSNRDKDGIIKAKQKANQIRKQKTLRQDAAQ